MTELNTNTYYVKKVDANDVQLYSDSLLRNTVDGTGFTAYTSGGTGTVATGSLWIDNERFHRFVDPLIQQY